MMGLAEKLALEQAEFEQKFCFSVMHMPDVILGTCGHIPAEKFRDLDCREYWSRIKSENIRTIDGAIELALNMGLWAKFNTAGTGDYLFTYQNWAAEVEKLYALRTVMLSLQDIMKGIASRDLNQVMQVVSDLTALSGVGSRRVGYTAEEMHDEFVKHIDEGFHSIKTGLPAIDALIGGYFAQELTIIASRPGVGKTALTMHSARQIAFRKKERVLYCSVEMPREALWARMACGNAGVPWIKVRSNQATPEERERVKRCSEELKNAIGEWLVVDDESRTVEQIHKAVITLDPDMVFIDQLDDISRTRTDMPKHEWLGWLMQALRGEIARGLKKPVCAIHQISRAPEGRDNKRPQMADLRSSGEIEQRMDIGLGLYRADIVEGRLPDELIVPMEIIPLKIRQGNTASVQVVEYDMGRQWFT